METNRRSERLNREYDPEIRLKDVFFSLLYRWRSILLVAVLCAAVLGAWQAFSVNAVHQAGNRTNDEQRYDRDVAQYRKELTAANKKLNRYQRVLNERLAYQEDSLLMQLDPENVWAAERKYLASGTEESAADVLAVYTGAMTADHDEAALEEAFGTANAGYAGEVVSIRRENDENAFRVTVYGSDRETAEKGLAYVAQKIAEAEKTAQGIEPHTLQVVNEGASRQILTDLTKKKNDQYDLIYKYREKVKTAERNVAGAKENEPLAPGDPVKRWALAGAGLGLLAMIGIYLIAFLQRVRLNSGDEISGRYGVPLYGEMNRSVARRPGKGIDGLLEKLEFRKDPKTEAQVYDNAAELVRGNRKEGMLLLAGTVGADVLNRVKAELEKRLGEEAGIEIRAKFPVESGAVEDARRAGSVLWVEEKHVSRNEKIRRAAEVFETAGADVIGALVV